LVDRHGANAAVSYAAIRARALVDPPCLEADLAGRETRPASNTLLLLEPTAKPLGGAAGVGKRDIGCAQLGV